MRLDRSENCRQVNIEIVTSVTLDIDLRPNEHNGFKKRT